MTAAQVRSSTAVERDIERERPVRPGTKAQPEDGHEREDWPGTTEHQACTAGSQAFDVDDSDGRGHRERFI
jgi:hypothetical protein